MPVPEGQITTSNIWTGEPLSEGEKNYKVTFLSRRETIITANSKEDALVRAKFRVSTVSLKTLRKRLKSYDLQ
jgi:hypothetical protein